MTPTDPKLISVNAPCPCGSGKKYKRCCGAGSAPTAAANQPAAKKSRRDLWLIGLGMVVLVAVTLIALASVNNRPTAARPAAGGSISGSGVMPTPKAWEFDAANNRHWDPAHGHWHDGPPPAGAVAK